MNAANHYEDAFQSCEDAFQAKMFGDDGRSNGHLTEMSVQIKGEGEFWPELAIGVCSRCGCILSQKMQNGTCYSVWINPANYQVLKVFPMELRKYWKRPDHILYEYDDGERSLVYVKEDAHGFPQLRYLKEDNNGNMNETVIVLPKHLRLSEYVE